MSDGNVGMMCVLVPGTWLECRVLLLYGKCEVLVIESTSDLWWGNFVRDQDVDPFEMRLVRPLFECIGQLACCIRSRAVGDQ